MLPQIRKKRSVCFHGAGLAGEPRGEEPTEVDSSKVENGMKWMLNPDPDPLAPRQGRTFLVHERVTGGSDRTVRIKIRCLETPLNAESHRLWKPCRISVF